MASSFSKIFHCCKKSCGNISRSLKKRLEYNPTHVPQFKISSSATQPMLNSNPERGLLQHLVVSTAGSSFKHNSTDSWPTVSCACGSYHSQNDAIFSQLLLDEINTEENHKLALPHFPDCWSLTQDGCDCKLSRLLDNDSIEVSFNVNGSVSGTSQQSAGEQDVVVQPDFVVQIKKQSLEDFLTFECSFPQDDTGEESGNAFIIRSLILHRGDIVESTYVMETDNINPILYNQMQVYLEERGINNEFAYQLIQIATAVENQQYIVFLENLQKFISCK